MGEMIEKPKASVVMVTYNHADFIAQAIESVLMQETDFAYELIIGEDESQDGTREICVEYANEYPDRIRLFLRSRENVIFINGRPTGRYNFVECLKAARGDYIAICEGDDYWTDSYKLQKQVEFLDSHPEFSICSHNVLRKYEDQDKDDVEWPGSELKENITLEDTLGGGYTVPTCSLVYRNNIFGEFPGWFYGVSAVHTALQTLCTSKGKMRYFREVMGVYRIHSGGISSGVKPDTQEQIDRFKAGVEKVEIINKHFDYNYDKLIRSNLIRYYYPNILGAYFSNWRRTMGGANEYARKLLEEAPELLPLPMSKRIKLRFFVIVSHIMIRLHKIIARFVF